MEQISLLDIEGVMVGQASDATAGTGCSVVVCPSGALGAVDVRGGAPATRETDLLRPDKANQEVHAVVLAGGSAFGLDACSGVSRWLEERHFGFDAGVGRVPIVCGASLFDLAYGSAAVRPDARMGYEACEDAFLASAVAEGNVGAGTGATVGKMCGSARAMKSGVGTYGLAVGDLKVAVLVAVNALGCVVDEHGAVLAGALAEDGASTLTAEQAEQALIAGQSQMSYAKTEPGPVANTVLACVVTNAKLTKDQLTRVCAMTHDGFARAIRPAHTSFDGDAAFALATGAVTAQQDVVGMLAADVVERAIRRAVLMAQGGYGLKSARDLGR